ncbi:hypothetical protein H0H87_008072 [Tephrocybe sp. NHM501043]|nr:hypothetical protein H0H87_008072 [Tephrocybe sp. NHM501043]
MAVCGSNIDKPLTLDMVEQMTYLNAFVKESMRVMPPVIIVTYKTMKPFPISEDYTVSVNSMVIPSFFNSLHNSSVYAESEEL